MSNLPKRMKNTEKVQSSQQAIRSDITSNPAGSSSAATEAYLRGLKLRSELGLLDPAEIRSLVPVESVEEQLTRRILKKLNRLGDHSAEFQLVARTYGSSDRLSLAQNMAKRFASAAALRNVTQLALGENMTSVNTFGQDLMDANMASSAANADPMKSGGGAGNA